MCQLCRWKGDDNPGCRIRVLRKLEGVLFLGGNEGVLGGRDGLKLELEGVMFFDSCVLTGEGGR